jgi:hypothetical protein
MRPNRSILPLEYLLSCEVAGDGRCEAFVLTLENVVPGRVQPGFALSRTVALKIISSSAVCRLESSGTNEEMTDTTSSRAVCMIVVTVYDRV